MNPALLTLNVGSSSIKFALFACAGDMATIPSRPALAGQYDGIATGQTARLTIRNGQGHVRADDSSTLPADTTHHSALAHLTDWLAERPAAARIVGVGHRVVHGAQEFRQPVVLDDATVARLRQFIPLAPLHQPHNLAGIEALHAALPGVPQVACFDTAFHSSQPAIAQLFPLPRRFAAQGVRRYGFHGLSYEYIADTLPQCLPPFLADGRVIVTHLGNGASLCAMVNRRSQATTMGFTTADGVMMGTRTGAIDPGVLLHLLNHAGMDAAALNKMIYQESGLLGVSGISADMRTLLASERPEAREAIDLFCYRIVREIGSLGVDLDETANADHALRISKPAARVATLVLPTNEEWMLARHTARLVA